MSDVEARLQAIGIVLPTPPTPAANYVPATIGAGLLFVSGQGPGRDGSPAYTGQLGAAISLEQGRAAARICAVNILAQAKAALDGDLDRIRRVVKVQGFVNALPDFTEHPAVMNGASDLFVEAFGEAGRHARFAVGAPSLPFGIAVEVDAIFEVA